MVGVTGIHTQKFNNIKYLDIGIDKWKSYSRSTNSYLQYFSLLCKIKYHYR